MICLSLIQISSMDDVGVDGPDDETKDGGPDHTHELDGEQTGRFSLVNFCCEDPACCDDNKIVLYVLEVTCKKTALDLDDCSLFYRTDTRHFGTFLLIR